MPVKQQQQTNNPNAPAAGSLFGLPGFTRRSTQKENNDGTVITLAQSNTVSAILPQNFIQTDIVERFRMDLTIAPTFTAGGATLTASPYFPYGFLGDVRLNFQNQFDAIHALNGIDLAIWEIIRPRYAGLPYSMLEQNPTTNAYSAQPNLMTATNYTTASGSIKFSVDLPAGLPFDLFYILDKNGQLVDANPVRGFINPLYMAGAQRQVRPIVNFNPLYGSRADLGPVTTTGGTPTASGSATLNFRRDMIYQPAGEADSPLAYNWQYVRQAFQVPLSGATQTRIPIPFSGQILSLALRFFDPAANSGVGAPIDVTTALTEVDLQYGSGLYKYQDTPRDAQIRFYRQHGVLLPAGVICHDMAMDDYGRVTNADVLNTLDTAGVQYYLQFSGAQSSSAYVVILVEGLMYVEMQ